MKNLLENTRKSHHFSMTNTLKIMYFPKILLVFKCSLAKFLIIKKKDNNIKGTKL